MTISAGVSKDSESKASATLTDLVRKCEGKDVALGEVVDALKDRGFGIFMILFALPNAVIPGLSFLLGAPVLLFALQLAAGRRNVWLSPFLARRSLPQAVFQKSALRAAGFLNWLEKRLRPRWTWLVSGQSERWLGLYIAVIAGFLMMPVPFGNALPAVGISFMAAGLIEKDGVAASFGIVLGFLGALYIAAALSIGVAAVKALIGLM